MPTGGPGKYVMTRASSGCVLNDSRTFERLTMALLLPRFNRLDISRSLGFSGMNGRSVIGPILGERECVGRRGPMGVGTADAARSSR